MELEEKGSGSLASSSSSSARCISHQVVFGAASMLTASVIVQQRMTQVTMSRAERTISDFRKYIEDLERKTKGALASETERAHQKLKPWLAKAEIMINQLEDSHTAENLRVFIKNAKRDCSEEATQRLKNCMEKAAQELGTTLDQVFEKAKESSKKELDELMDEVNVIASEMRDPEVREEFLNDVQATLARESIILVRTLKEIIEEGRRTLEGIGSDRSRAEIP